MLETCFICGKTYDSEKRKIALTLVDRFGVKSTVKKLALDGRVIRVCSDCTKAMAVGNCYIQSHGDTFWTENKIEGVDGIEFEDENKEDGIRW